VTRKVASRQIKIHNYHYLPLCLYQVIEAGRRRVLGREIYCVYVKVEVSNNQSTWSYFLLDWNWKFRDDLSNSSLWWSFLLLRGRGLVSTNQLTQLTQAWIPEQSANKGLIIQFTRADGKQKNRSQSKGIVAWECLLILWQFQRNLKADALKKSAVECTVQ
jgi:hypothetical protein